MIFVGWYNILFLTLGGFVGFEGVLGLTGLVIFGGILGTVGLVFSVFGSGLLFAVW